MKKTLASVLIIVVTFPLFAAIEVVDGIVWTYFISNGKATIGSGGYVTPAIPNTTQGTITVPTELGGYPVMSIAQDAFAGCSSLTSVTIPEGVTTIGHYAFAGCSSLTSVTIPEGVTVIGRFTFRGCSSLTSVTIPEGVTVIGDYAFQGCSSLTLVTIPEGVTTIGDCAFQGCSSLTSVTIPEGVTTIGDYAFQGCSSLTSVTIPEGVTTIGHYAFQGCSSLTSVTIPEGVTTIGHSAFQGCSSLTSVTIPESVTSSGSWSSPGPDLVIFNGKVPQGFNFGNTWSSTTILFPQKYGAEWEQALGSNRFTVGDVLIPSQVKVEAWTEQPTPKTIKVTYTVKSELPSVKVRAVAWKDGVRSFANIVPVRTGEGVPHGESVSTNEGHSFVWDVASDWDSDLDKISVEILVQEGKLLPQELITIPATKTHKAMTITRNKLREQWLFDALVWCYVEGDPHLVNQSGWISTNGVSIACHSCLPTSFRWINEALNTSSRFDDDYEEKATALLNYLYGKMGYKVLAGKDLEYAEAATRLDFEDENGNYPLRQVSVKIEEE